MSEETKTAEEHKLFLEAGKEYLGDEFDMLSMDVDTHQIALIAIKKAMSAYAELKKQNAELVEALKKIEGYLCQRKKGVSNAKHLNRIEIVTVETLAKHTT